LTQGCVFGAQPTMTPIVAHTSDDEISFSNTVTLRNPDPINGGGGGQPL